LSSTASRRVSLGLVLAAIAVCAVLAADSSPVQFTEALIQDGYGYAFGVQAADLDGDGDLDLTSCDTTTGAMYWFENDGQGRFKRHVIQQNESGWFERHWIADLNGDGKPDVGVVKNQQGALVWFKNTGTPRDGKPWPRFVITTNQNSAYDIVFADLDGDGDADAVASSWVRGREFAWYENNGTPEDGKEWTKHVIESGLKETRTVRIADFNKDGRPDVLGTDRLLNLVVWYENPGKAGGPWKRHVIDDKSPMPTHGHAVDMDGDGDADVVMALGMLAPAGTKETHQIVWYENLGSGLSWKKHVIGELEGAFEAFAADLDGDKKLDVVATSWGPRGEVCWFKNPGDPKGQWTKHLLKTPWPRANAIIAADLNGDGRIDLAATAERGANELRWWRNDGARK
jgi:hypothetical protein